MRSLARHTLSSCCVRTHPFSCAGPPAAYLRRYNRMSAAVTGSINSPSSQQPAGAASAAAAAAGAAAEAKPDPIVQYVVLRKDLWGDQGWPLGPVIAQACHASSAAMISHYDTDATTREYVAPANIDHMHKVVLEVKGEAQLRTLSQKLQEAGVKHKLWIEQPEDFPTCLATKPYRRSEVGQHFKKCQLCKAELGGKQQQ